jgi:hypothetical protein
MSQGEYLAPTMGRINPLVMGVTLLVKPAL